MSALVLIETTANQDWVFSSNRLRDVVGGSELLARSTTVWLFDTLYELGLNHSRWSDDAEARSKVLLSALNTDAIVPVVMATSGKAVAMAPDADTARSVISSLTLRCIVEAPGLDLRGVWVESDLTAAVTAVRALLNVHQLLDRVRTQTTATVVRGARRPIVAGCVATGRPANQRVREAASTREEPLSDSSVARRHVITDARWRFDTVAGLRNDSSTLAAGIEEFDEGDRLALVHIDTNGLGAVFADPMRLVRNDEHPFDAIRRFAIAVDTCAAGALRDALATIATTLKRPDHLKLVPILAGGDDTTVLCRGTDAFEFVGQYLAAFEHHTTAHADVGARLATTGQPPVPLTACAGVVWTKASYPLSLTMELAGDLCRQAKAAVAAAGVPFSAWEFHDIHDSVAVSWESVIDELTIGGGDELLCHRPVYVSGSHPRWHQTLPVDIQTRTHALLRTRVEACVGAHRRTSTSGLTTSQLYQLREALFFGVDVADQQFGLVEHRCGEQQELRADGNSLFYGETVRTTPLLDAMTIARNVL